MIVNVDFGICRYMGSRLASCFSCVNEKHTPKYHDERSKFNLYFPNEYTFDSCISVPEHGDDKEVEHH